MGRQQLVSTPDLILSTGRARAPSFCLVSCPPHAHLVRGQLDVVMVSQPALQCGQEALRVQLVAAAVGEQVQRLQRRLAQLQTVVDLWTAAAATEGMEWSELTRPDARRGGRPPRALHTPLDATVVHPTTHKPKPP